MREYAKIVPVFWVRGTGKKLRGDAEAQVLAIYLMTCPNSNMVGIYNLSLPSMQNDTGLSEAAIRRCLKLLAAHDVAHFDARDEMVWVPEMARYQVGETLSAGDKQIRGIIKELAKVGRHQFVCRFFTRYTAAYRLDVPAWVPNDTPSEGVTAPADTPSEGSPTQSAPLRSQDQDQDQDQEVPLGKPTGAKANGDHPTDKAWQRYAAAYAEGIAAASGEGFATPRTKTDLVQMATAHGKTGGKAITGDALLAWFRTTATAYRKATADKAAYESGYCPAACLKWLNAGRPVSPGAQMALAAPAGGQGALPRVQVVPVDPEAAKASQEAGAAALASFKAALHGHGPPPRRAS